MGSQSDEEYLEEFDFVRQKLEGVFPPLFFYENSDDEKMFLVSRRKRRWITIFIPACED
jgi:hypothetical protein